MLETYTDYKEMLTKADIDAAIIAVPHPLHAEVGIFAFAHGKHVLVEKPMALRSLPVSGCALLHGRAASFSASCSISAQVRFSARRAALCRAGNSDSSSGRVWVVTNWYRTDTYYASGAWRASWRGEGGGLLVNQAAHNLDLWQWICGMPTAFDCALQCRQIRRTLRLRTMLCCTPSLRAALTGVFISSTGDLPGTNRLEIVGTRGKVVIEGGKVVKHWRLPTDERSICASSAGELPRMS